MSLLVLLCLAYQNVRIVPEPAPVPSVAAAEPAVTPYRVVLTNKKIMKVRAAPECDGKRCRITLLNGEITSVPAAMIDLDATEELQQQLAEERAAAERARIEARKAEAERRAEQQAKVAEKTIILGVDDALPRYQRNNRPVTTEAPAATEPDPDYTQEFTSEEPVFVASEAITVTESGTTIAATVKVQSTTGAENISVTLVVDFDEAGSTTVTKTIPGKMTINTTRTITFQVAETDAIVRTSYEVAATIPAQ